MKEGEVLDVTVIIKTECPHCEKVNVETLGREPDEMDVLCEHCNEYYTIHC